MLILKSVLFVHCSVRPVAYSGTVFPIYQSCNIDLIALTDYGENVADFVFGRSVVTEKNL